MKNFFKNNESKRNEETNKIFENLIIFDYKIQQMYENINAKKVAERQLYKVKQTKSTFKYVAVF